MKSKTKVKLPKPVKGWSMIDKVEQTIYAYWTFDDRREYADERTFHRVGSLSGKSAKYPNRQFIPVIIADARHYRVVKKSKPTPKRKGKA